MSGLSDEVSYFLSPLPEADVQRCSVKTVFLEISQNSQENTYASLFFNKVTGLKRDSGTGVFLRILGNF